MLTQLQSAQTASRSLLIFLIVPGLQLSGFPTKTVHNRVRVKGCEFYVDGRW